MRVISDVVSTESSSRERIVIYRLGSLGDTIVALPCLHKVAAVFPNAERYILTNEPVSTNAAPMTSLLANSGLVHGTIAYPLGTRSLRKLWDLARRLRELQAETFVYLTGPRGGYEVERDNVFFRLCGFRRIIGAPFARAVRERHVDPVTGIHEPEWSRLARTISELGPIDLDDPANWDLCLTPEERAKGACVLASFEGRPFIALNMGGKNPRNHWGDENWRNLLGRLAASHGAFGLLAVGASADAAAGDQVMAGWPGLVVNACGALLPRESAAALEKASLFLGHDSGPMHLAASRGVRCVALFGETNPPRVFHPCGKGHRIIHNMKGVAAIEIAQVAAAVHEALPPSRSKDADAA